MEANGKPKYQPPVLNSITVNDAWNDLEHAHQQYCADFAKLKEFMQARIKGEKAGVRALATMLNATFVVSRMTHMLVATYCEEQ